MRSMRPDILAIARKVLLATLVATLAIPSLALADERWCDDGHHWKRVWGATAYDTMQAVLVTQDVFPEGGVEHVIIATGDGYWDALSAAGLAGVNDTAILITPSDHLGDQARAELERMRPHYVHIVGGRAAVSDRVEADVKDLLGIPMDSNIRLAGTRASDTAIAIFRAGDPTKWNAGNDESYCIVATTYGYWDALSVAPLAYARHIPIFLADYDTESGGYILSDNTLEAMKLGVFDHVIIVGGKAAVSKTVETQVKQLESEAGPVTVERWDGDTAIDTSAKIARHEIDDFSMFIGNMMVATSNGYWDALSAAPVAGRLNSVLVLMDQFGNNHQAFDAVFSKDEVGIGYVLGGKMALSEAVEGYIVSQSM